MTPNVNGDFFGMWNAVIGRDGRGRGMLSVVAVMPVSTEQTEVRTAPMERGDIESSLFAEDFQAKAALHVEMQAKAGVDQVGVLPTLKGTVVPGRSGELNSVAYGSANMPATKQILTDVQVAKSSDLRLTGFREDGTATRAIAKLQLSTEDANATDAKLAAALNDVPAPSGDVARFGTSVQAPTSGHALEQSDVEKAAIQNERTEAAMTPPPIETIRKNVTTQKSVEEMKRSTVKAAEKVAAQNGIEPKPGAGVGVQVEVTVPPQGLRIADGSKEEIDGSLEGGSNATGLSMVGRAGATFTTRENVERKANVAVVKADGADKAAGPDAQHEQASSAKPEFDLAKITVVAGSSVSNDLEKTQQPTGTIHAVPGNAGSISGLIPGIVSMHVADGAVAKLQSGATHSQTAIAEDVPSGLNSSSGSGETSSVEAMHTTVIATPTALEVGIPNGTHGWLKVRAEMSSDGVVNASLSPASSAAQEMLHHEIPSLTSYLQQERVAVNAIVVHAPSDGGGGRQLSGQMDSGDSARHGGTEGGSRQQGAAGTTPEHAEETLRSEGLNEIGIDESPLQALYPRGGNWLNVRV